MAENTVLRSLRLNAELDAWFNENFPWRGSLPQFVNAAIEAFKKEYGDRLPPHKILEGAMAKMAPRFPA
jgi:hypothetical protein